jgi:hypothetical protein
VQLTILTIISSYIFGRQLSDIENYFINFLDQKNIKRRLILKNLLAMVHAFLLVHKILMNKGGVALPCFKNISNINLLS